MVAVGRRLPLGAPAGEQEAGAGGLDVDGLQQARHPAGGEEQAVEAAIGSSQACTSPRPVAGPGRRLGPVEDRRGEVRGGVRSASTSRAARISATSRTSSGLKPADAHAAARLAHHQPLRLEAPDGLPLTGTWLAPNSSATASCRRRDPRRQAPGDDALGQGPADPHGDRFVVWLSS